MLRRKLLMLLVPLVALLAVTLIVSILLLQDVLRQIERPAEVVTRFKWLVLSLGLVFLFVINVAVLVLLRVAGMVLRPVEKLVAASRELGREHFEHRVEIGPGEGEFDELGRAYNRLAEQLQANERRRIEAIGQLALTLNHELNNAMALIEMQLQLVSRRATHGEPVESALIRIQDALGRMGQTVASLKHIKRIVLTDYVEGTKMLDLRRSTEEEPVHG
jgi:nitrate/nitrite-specific signal transduction histidine kinase